MSEPVVDYSAAGVPVRDDLRRTHLAMLEYLRKPGCWFTGAERLALAAESRNALACALCRERKASLSPEHPKGEHARVTDLPEALVEIAHRIRLDPQRLSREWFDRVRAAGLEEERHVELVGIVTFTAGIDYFCRALGIPPFRLPDPLPGEPSRYRPQNARGGTAWVAMLAPEDATGPEADLYGAGMIPNIARALSLVPDHVRLLQLESASHYVAMSDIGNPSVRRDLDRLQIELVAARVSAMNECFY
jgi:alkylhydroperoxidase family enzyme